MKNIILTFFAVLLVSFYFAAVVGAQSTYSDGIVFNGDRNLFSLSADRTYSSSLSVGGLINIDNTRNNREALVIYSGDESMRMLGAMLRLENTSLNQVSGMLRINSDSSFGKDYDIRIDSGNPDIELIDTNYNSPNGKFEIDVGPAYRNGALRFNSRNLEDSSFETIGYFTPLKDGGEFVVNGEIRNKGVSGDGIGKVICVNSDGNLGTCLDRSDLFGICSCY